MAGAPAAVPASASRATLSETWYHSHSHSHSHTLRRQPSAVHGSTSIAHTHQLVCIKGCLAKSASIDEVAYKPAKRGARWPSLTLAIPTGGRVAGVGRRGSCSWSWVAHCLGGGAVYLFCPHTRCGHPLALPWLWQRAGRRWCYRLHAQTHRAWGACTCRVRPVGGTRGRYRCW